MSTQHLDDQDQLRRTQMKLAMAVGDRRHYRLDEILPRPFKQTAARAGVPESTVEEILTQLADAGPAALDEVCGSLPADFPEDVRDSVAGGISQRIKSLREVA